MKNVKRLLALGLAVVMTAGVLTGCGNDTAGGSDAASGTETDANQNAGGEDAAQPTPSAEGGSVYYLNFKPEQDPQWQELAKAYTEETGVEVTVVTAASGEYETTLMSEMGKSGAPTMFQENAPVVHANWKDY